MGLGMNKERKRLRDDEASFDTEKAARGQVRPHDEPCLVEGQIADRGKIVELGIFTVRLFKLLPGPAKLLVLRLELYLMDGEFMKELLKVHPGRGRQFLGRTQQEFSALRRRA